MGRERQKAKNRSGISKVRHKQPTKSGKKKINFLGNALLAANWDKSETLTQNYRRLGLTPKLNKRTGGVEKTERDEKDADAAIEPLHISSHSKQPIVLQPTEVQVERDPKTGRILRVLHSEQSNLNPLNDPLNDLDSDPEDLPTSPMPNQPKKSSGIVPTLESQAEAEASMPRKKRQQSQREGEWIGRLVEKHGEDVKAMSRDARLNVMQQSKGDLRKRVRRWRVEREGV